MTDQNLSRLGPHRSAGQFKSGRFLAREQNIKESYGDDDEYRSPEKRKEFEPSRLGNSTGDEEDEGGEEEAEIRAAIGEVRGVAGISERQ